MKKLLTILFTVLALSSFGQSLFNRWFPASGTDTYTTNITSFTTYSNTVVYLKFANTNTGTSTININSIGAQPIRAWDGDSWEVLTAGHIDVNTVYKLSYNGSYMEMESFGAGGGGGSGTVNSGSQYRLGYYATAGTAISEANAITASRALVSDANGVPDESATTATELGYVSGVTSAIQTQINTKANKALTHNTQTANYVAVLTDADSKVVVMDVASSNTFTVPQFSSVAYPEGAILYVQNKGAGTTTLTAGTGVTFNHLLGSSATLLTGGIATLKHSATQNTWDVLNYTGGGSALTKTDDTNVTLTLGGSPTTALSAAASITAGWTGTLSLARGGKGTSTDPTTGSVWFEGASGATEDNSNLFFDDSGNMLGVGLAGTAPTAYVDIGATTTANASLRLRSGTAPTTKLDGQIYNNGTNLIFVNGTTEYVVPRTLSGSASLNFGNTTSTVPTDLTITVTGAAVGDVVGVGGVPPNGTTFYYAWVSASNTVTVRLINVGADVDPSATTITVLVRK